MKKTLMLGMTAVVVTVLSLLLVGTVLAEEPSDVPDSGSDLTPWSRIERGAGVVRQAVADLLGMTMDEMAAALDDGSSLADLAADEGLTDEDLSEAVTTAVEEAMTQNTEERYAGLTWENLDLQLSRQPTGRGEQEPLSQTAPRPLSQDGRKAPARSAVPEAVNELLDMTDEEIYSARTEGFTLAEIAESQGVSEEDLLQALTEESTAAIEEALADGSITADQADWLLSRQAALAGYEATNPFAPGDEWRPIISDHPSTLHPFGRR